MQAAIGSFSLLAVCVFILNQMPPTNAITACFATTFLLSGLVALFHSDNLECALRVIVGQLLALFLSYCFLNLVIKDQVLQQQLGQHASEAWGCMVVAACINLTTKRHQLLCLLSYLALDVILAWGAVTAPQAHGCMVLGELLSFVVIAGVGAGILLVPVFVGGLRRAREGNPPGETED